MDLHVDIRWLLERQADLLPKHPEVHDFSALVAAVARHRVNTPRIGTPTGAAWWAAALMVTLVRLRPLPARNALFGAAVAVAYMDASGQGIDPPYGALIDLARDIDAARADVYDTADRLRSWRI
ncbi:toxin Doc [Streptomyces sp. WMMC1477]|uniref:toxin Doc n=1 Tax=Streptomyces sp. WMMC1477 TaxID=3015155 RepID=UPI003FCC9710